MAEFELNKIVSMIMENPELIEKIKAMSEGAAETHEKAAGEPEVIKELSAAPNYTPKSSKRNELLRALEAFLSDKRKKSLETMITIADVLDSVKRKES